MKRLLWTLALTTAIATTLSAETYTLDANGEPVEVVRDSYGVPHVFAESFRAMFFGHGYVAAEDRLWQLEMYRRDARGELAELLGEKHLEKDRRARRQYRIESERQEIWERIDPETQAAFEGYRDGVNAYIKKAVADDKLPREYADIKTPNGSPYVPRDWQTTDSLAIIHQMSDRFGSGGTEELEYQAALNKLSELHGYDEGRAIFEDLIPRNDRDAPTTMPKTWEIQYEKTSAPPVRHLPDRLLHEYADARAADLAVAQEIGSFTKLGSNAWIVSPKRSATKNALLFGGPMMGFRAPQIAYEVHLSGPARLDGTGKMNVIGMAFGGIPFVLIGHNDTAAWTTTSGGGNVSDLYLETLDADDPMKYESDGKWLPITVVPEIIRVRNEDGSMRDVSDVGYRTIHGPVVSMDKDAGIAVAAKHSYWQTEADNGFKAFLEFNRMRSADEFLKACALIATTHHFFYADQKGDIAYAFVGKYAQRPLDRDWRLPMRGSGVDEWLGYMPFKEQPQVVNPPQGYIGNWNNKPSDDWESAYGRVFWGHRIDKRLAADASVTVEEAADLARETGTNDFIADYFDGYLQHALDMLDARPETAAVRSAIGNYDRVLGVGSVGERVYDTFARALIRVMFEDEMPFMFESPKMGDTETLLLLSFALRVLEPEVSFLKPSRDYLNGKTEDEVLTETLTRVYEQLGSDPSKWNAEPKTIRFGDAGEIAWARRGTFMQMVELAKPRVKGQNILPPGQSEDPSSPHFKDQLDLYGNWRYKPTALDRTELK
ncbi:MAG: penicillin acylase family protein [Candidatus Poribacteria bacterium]|nr:penicillin acylase family protein [Candidatus Poribacteria bacterium]